MMATDPRQRLLQRSLRNTALRCLCQREQSRTELRARLLRSAVKRPRHASAIDGDARGDEGGAGDDGDDGEKPAASLASAVDAVLDQLTEQGLLSDQRFLDTRVHARRSQWGQRRIAHELQQHGLVLDPATSASLQRSELARAAALWRRHFDTPAHAPPEPKERLRQMRFLAARGFSGDVVRRVVQAQGGLDEAAEPGDEPA